MHRKIGKIKPILLRAVLPFLENLIIYIMFHIVRHRARMKLVEEAVESHSHGNLVIAPHGLEFGSQFKQQWNVQIVLKLPGSYKAQHRITIIIVVHRSLIHIIKSELFQSSQ